MQSGPATGILAWVGLAAADAPVAVEFYTAAFGWEAVGEADHTRLSRAGSDVALVYQQTPQARAANVTPHWSPFFLADDADRALERTVAAGGMALRDPFDVTGGRVAPLQDPAGATFSIWAPSSPAGPDRSPSELWWIELSAPDVNAARAFYGDLLGWGFEESPSGVVVRGPDGPSGRIRSGAAGPEWSPLLRVADAEDAARRAEAAGARSVGSAEEGPFGRVLSIVDPQGAQLSLLESA